MEGEGGGGAAAGGDSDEAEREAASFLPVPKDLAQENNQDEP